MFTRPKFGQVGQDVAVFHKSPLKKEFKKKFVEFAIILPNMPKSGLMNLRRRRYRLRRGDTSLPIVVDFDKLNTDVASRPPAVSGLNPALLQSLRKGLF